MTTKRKAKEQRTEKIKLSSETSYSWKFMCPNNIRIFADHSFHLRAVFFCIASIWKWVQSNQNWSISNALLDWIANWWSLLTWSITATTTNRVRIRRNSVQDAVIDRIFLKSKTAFSLSRDTKTMQIQFVALSKTIWLFSIRLVHFNDWKNSLKLNVIISFEKQHFESLFSTFSFAFLNKVIFPLLLLAAFDKTLHFRSQIPNPHCVFQHDRSG